MLINTYLKLCYVSLLSSISSRRWGSSNHNHCTDVCSGFSIKLNKKKKPTNHSSVSGTQMTFTWYDMANGFVYVAQILVQTQRPVWSQFSSEKCIILILWAGRQSLLKPQIARSFRQHFGYFSLWLQWIFYKLNNLIINFYFKTVTIYISHTFTANIKPLPWPHYQGVCLLSCQSVVPVKSFSFLLLLFLYFTIARSKIKTVFKTIKHPMFGEIVIFVV